MILTPEESKKILQTEYEKVLAKLEAVSVNEEIKKWLKRKAIAHPYLVYEAAVKIRLSQEVLARATSLGLEIEDFKRINDVNALLHDLGRLQEIDETTGLYKPKFDHAEESWKMLKEICINESNILLPVRYHSLLDFRSKLFEDEDFLKLSESEKEQAAFFGELIADADKLGNIIEVSNKGLEGRRELFDSKYSHAARISPHVKEAILAGEITVVKNDMTLVDVLLRYVAWVPKMYFETSKKIGAEYLDGIFEHITNGVDDEKFLTEIAEIYAFLKGETNV